MKKNPFALAAVVVAFGVGAAGANAQEVLTGDTRLACEAILCLATGTRPSECTPSLQRYFGISYKSLSDTLRGRQSFLNLCPVSNQTLEMQSLINAQVMGAGRCDAQSLNITMVMWRNDEFGQYISSKLPDYCTAYTTHAYTDFKGRVPRYVGTEQRGGYWVEASEYEAALAAYNERIKREDEERERERQRRENQY